MVTRIVFRLTLLTLAHTIMAQESWLQPDKFRYAIGSEIKIDFLTGENFVGESEDNKKSEAVEWFSAAGRKPVSREVTAQEGTKLLVLESPGTSREWKAENFYDYLKENGLEDAAATGRKSQPLAQPVRETSIRYARLLIQVGAKLDDAFGKKTGQRLEIIPDKNPYSLKTGDHLKCLILYDGKPSPHTLVKVWSQLNRTTFLQNIYTEDDGTILFPISTKGAWMVSTVKLVSGERAGVDWVSLWTTLVFGI